MTNGATYDERRISSFGSGHPVMIMNTLRTRINKAAAKDASDPFVNHDIEVKHPDKNQRNVIVIVVTVGHSFSPINFTIK